MTSLDLSLGLVGVWTRTSQVSTSTVMSEKRFSRAPLVRNSPQLFSTAAARCSESSGLKLCAARIAGPLPNRGAAPSPVITPGSLKKAK